MDFVIFAINFFFSLYYIMLALRAVLPWFPHNRADSLVSPIYRLTDPVLYPIRMGLPPQRIGMDVAPFFMIILLWLVQRIIMRLLTGA